MSMFGVLDMIPKAVNSLIPNMFKAKTINRYLRKGARQTGKMIGEYVNYMDNKLNDPKPKNALPIHKEEKEPKTKAEKIFELGGVWGTCIAYNHEIVEQEELTDSFFSTIRGKEFSEELSVECEEELLDASELQEQLPLFKPSEIIDENQNEK